MLKKALLFLALATWSVELWASAVEFVPIQERAQGQSLSGANLLNDSLYSNPASSAFVPVYAVEGTFLLPRSFAVSVLDTRTSAIGGALGYFRRSVDYSDELMQGFKLALSTRVSEVLAVGLAGKSVWGPSVVGDSRRLMDMDAGVLANLGFLQTGLTMRNVLGGDSALALDREWAYGIRLNYQEAVFLSASMVSRWGGVDPYQWGIGLEYVSPYYFSIKGGYRLLPQSRETFWSAGLSLLTPKLTVHYAAEFPSQGPKAIEHILAAAILF